MTARHPQTLVLGSILTRLTPTLVGHDQLGSPPGHDLDCSCTGRALYWLVRQQPRCRTLRRCIERQLGVRGLTAAGGESTGSRVDANPGGVIHQSMHSRHRSYLVGERSPCRHSWVKPQPRQVFFYCHALAHDNDTLATSHTAI